MRHVRTVLSMVWSLALVSVAEDKTQPVCKHNLSRNIHVCSGLVVTTINSEKAAIINCKGLPLDCSKLQQLDFASNKTIKKLKIQNCALISSMECVMSKLNATGTRTIWFDAVSTQVTEETVRGLQELDSLYIFDTLPSIKMTVPVEAMKVLPNLYMLRYRNSGLTALPPNTFKQAGKDLGYLEISSNNITTLPADAFNGLKNLKKLFLFENEIKTVDENAFRGLDSLQNLCLDENRISVLPAGLFHHTPRLQSLTMFKSLKSLRVQTGALMGLAHLEKLVLRSYEVLTLDPGSLSELPSLRTLDLQDSSITELPADLLRNTTALITLILANNNLSSLPETIFEGLKKLEILDLRKNLLKVVTNTVFEPLKGLREILLDENLITYLPEGLFSTLSSLHTVSLAHNKISEVHQLAFLGAAVKDLDLSHNQLAWNCKQKNAMMMIDNDIELIKQSSLAMLDKLKKLDLSHNSISSICSDWTQVMTSLEKLNLSNNSLANLSTADINFHSYNITVDLRDNQIATLSPPSNTHPTLLLGRNPFNCDCHLYEFLKQLKNLPYKVEDAKCKLPPSMEGLTLASAAVGTLGSSLSLSNWTCSLPVNPQGCICIVRPAMNRTECICDSIKGKVLPIPSNSGPTINDMQLTLRTKQNLDALETLPSFVTSLILSNLGLEIVPDIPETVTHLDLRHNKLSRVPLEILQRNITLELSNNSLKCDCWSKDDVANLKNNLDKINDSGSLYCVEGGLVKDVDLSQLCYVIIATAIGVSLAVFGIILAIVCILICKYSLEIKIYLYNRGWTSLVKEETLDANKKYHIFLSYVHQDEEFVKTHLLPELDKHYKVCVHTRDWIVGDKIVDQIYRSVAQSRRTLIVLSNAFLESNSWALAEFEAAHAQSAQDNLPRAVIVLLEDVNCDNAPDHIKRHMKTNTYIKWGDSKFWDRLRYALPRKMKAEDVRRRRMTALAAKNLAEGGLNVVLNDQGVLINADDVK